MSDESPTVTVTNSIESTVFPTSFVTKRTLLTVTLEFNLTHSLGYVLSVKVNGTAIFPSNAIVVELKVLEE